MDGRGADRHGSRSSRPSSSRWTTRGRGAAREELTAAVVADVRRGARAHRWTRSTRRRRSATRSSTTRVVASLLLIHDLYPVPLEERVAAGARPRAARTWSRTAATSSCSASRTASRGCAWRAAAAPARPRRRRSSWPFARRSRSCARTSRAWTSRASRSPSRSPASRCRWPARRRRTATRRRSDRWSRCRWPVRRGPARRRGSTSTASRRWLPRSSSRPTCTDRSSLIANVEGTLLAYRNSCASCGGGLDRGVLSSGALMCPGCGRSYFLPRAGRSLDDERLQLAPVPLLRENGSVRVALAS